MSSPASPSTRCPACGEQGVGRFCATCGAARDGSAPSAAPAPCADCGAALAPGAKFCHRCGLAAGAPASGALVSAAARADRSLGLAAPAATPGAVLAPAPVQQQKALLPWGIAFIAVLSVVAMAAAQNLGRSKGGRLDAPMNALPQAALGEAPPAGAAGPFAGGGAPGTGGAPDLSQMSPRDIADRLFDRVMRLSSEGKADSAVFFANMALQNYASMGSSIDLDGRYDMGRIAEVAGNDTVARAQADTILAQAPNHLLGLILAGKAAAMRGDAKAVAEYEQRLAKAAPTERPRNLEEYQRHAYDIETALKQIVPAASGR